MIGRQARPLACRSRSMTNIDRICTGGPENGHTAAPALPGACLHYEYCALHSDVAVSALISMPARLRRAALLSRLLDQIVSDERPGDCAVSAACIARQHSSLPAYRGSRAHRDVSRINSATVAAMPKLTNKTISVAIVTLVIGTCRTGDYDLGLLWTNPLSQSLALCLEREHRLTGVLSQCWRQSILGRDDVRPVLWKLLDDGWIEVQRLRHHVYWTVRQPIG
jgi:hypothetical protein